MRMGTQELIILFLIVFLLFGASRLPQLGGSLGSAIRNFKKGFGGEEEKQEPPKSIPSGSVASSTETKDKANEKS